MKKGLPFVGVGIFLLALTSAWGSWIAIDPDSTGGGGVGPFCQMATYQIAPLEAIAVVRVPWQGTGTQVHYEIRNLAPSGEAIEHVTLSGFAAASGRGVCFRCATPVVQPADGSMRIAYPTPGSPGDGPAVLTFESFDAGECAAFRTGIEAHDGTGDLQARDLVDARIEIVFNGDLRGVGTFRLCGPRGTIVPALGHKAVPCDPGDLIAIVFEPV